MGFGMFAFTSLGDEYFANGALAGLYAAFFVAIVSVLLGDKTPTVYAPRINSTFFLGALLYGLVHSEAGSLHTAGATTILAVFFSVILLGGVFQALFGPAKVGTLIRFTPHPVFAGFQNAAAVLLFLVQLADVGGFEQSKPFTFVVTHPDMVKPLSVFLAGLTFAAMWNGRRIIPAVPPLLIGLAVGTATYYALVALGLREYLGPTIGAATVEMPTPALSASVGDLLNSGWLFEFWPTILGGGLALAIIASIDALLCSKLVCSPGDPRTDADRLLLRLGLGNVVSACFGGITSGINIGPTLTNRAFGGRTPLSVLVNAVSILLAFTVLFPLLTLLPRAVLSAVIMVAAVQHLDPWSIKLVERVAAGAGLRRRHLVLDLLVVVLVAALSISVNIVLAVFIGIAIAVVLFVLRMSRSIVRRSYRCNAVHSRRSRDAAELKALERHGGAILVMELDGALFFGTGERLLDAIADATQRDTRSLILDLRRVSEIDSTGARAILDIQADLERKGIRLGLILADESDSMLRLKDMAVFDRIPRDQIFEDLDRAVEWAENELLRDMVVKPVSAGEIRLERVGILRDLDPAEIASVTARLTRVAHAKGEVIFDQGDRSNDLFIVTRGTASAYIRRPQGRDVRLVTFAPGTVFGELATLDARPRSASIVADDEFVGYALSRAQFAALSREAPVVAIKLLVSLARELSDRLRRADRMIDELEM